MDNYLLLKLLHILSAVVITGTGAGIAFFMLMAYRSKNAQAIYLTTKTVILADWLFTTPAIISQLLTGILLMNILGFSYSSVWFYHVIALFGFIGACWLPVVYIQYQLRREAVKGLQQSQPTAAFNRLMKIWMILGVPAFVAIIGMFWLMLFKPFSVL